ncbi:MAG: hypothetical protein IAF94_15605 [Pirellulaceae bacterium]|nr:hypothetical protein [Pirellulaceae bacterium]
MNYLAHGWRFANQPYFLAGTAVPDWLSVIDRKMRARGKTAALFVDDADENLAALARGIVQHHRDDKWFHQTTAFNELSLGFTMQIRDVLPADDGFRPSFLGHILVELLLDATLSEEEPARLDRYYAALSQADPIFLQAAINRLSTRQSDKVAFLVTRFLQERFLYDYAEDGKLLVRLNHVMKRVGLPQLPDDLKMLFPAMRVAVRNRRHDLLPSDTYKDIPR